MPRLEALEDRLQPGDWLLGALLGGSPGVPELLAGVAATWALGDEQDGGPRAARREAQPDYWAAAGPVDTTPVPVPSPAPYRGPGAPDQRPSAGEGPGVALTQPTSTSPTNELFASAFIDPLIGIGTTGRYPARLAPESPAALPAPGGAATGAAAPAGQAVNGAQGFAPPPVAQHGPDVAALGYYAGLSAAPRPGVWERFAPNAAEGAAVSAAPAGPSVSLREAAGAVHARFELLLGSTADSPFPSNRWTTADDTQNTGRHIALPPPAQNTSDWDDVQVLNKLDGFNLQPRLSIPFDGPIDPDTVTSSTVFLIRLGDTLDHQDHGGQIVGIDQVVWDVGTNTLHVESDQLLDQHTRYALVVTSGVHDAGGEPIRASEEFERFRHDINFGQTHDADLKAYRKDLLDGLKAARDAGVPERDVVTASVFTTMSATAILEKIRDQIHAATPAPADFLLGPGGTRTVFPRSSVGNTITWNQQTRVVGALNPVPVNLSPLDIFPGAVGRLAFGKYSSPDYLVHPDQVIPPVGTRTGEPAVQAMNEIYFNLYLPSGPMPVNGWPVAIFGHGINQGKDSPAPLNVAGSLAAHGVATLTINAVGHGFGPLSTLTVTTAGGPVTFSARGRGVDQNLDTRIGSSEGVSAGGPHGPLTGPLGVVGYSDGFRQTAADLMQLTRVIGVGMDVDGDGSPDLDPGRIYYFGSSLGGGYGTVFTAVEPSVRAGVLNVPFDPIPAGSLAFRNVVGNLLTWRQPSSLLNAPGIKFLNGLEVSTPYFDDNQPLRDQTPLTVRLADGTTRVIQSPVHNTVAGATAIQQVTERYEWVGQAGSPAAYAPHLRKDPLPGVDPKSVIIEVAKGDQLAPNPTTTAIVRAGELTDRMVYYRHDLAWAANPSLPKNPHGFVLGVANFGAIALAAQAQIATFFELDGPEVLPPIVGDAARFFEVAIMGSLPEGLNYLP